MSIAKLRIGTTAWFDMVGASMSEAAERSGLPPALTVSLIERYKDGLELSDGFFQGIRFDIVNGQPSFRIGVRPDERADITIEISAAAAKTLNSLRSADPDYLDMINYFLRAGDMSVEGDPSRMGSWLESVHDPIVDRTI